MTQNRPMRKRRRLCGRSASISALEELAAVENKTAAQKAVLQQLVEELNASIPELTLSYDAETDSLRDLATGAEMSAASIRELAQAEFERQEREDAVQRMTELLRDQKRLEEEIVSTKERLTAAQEKLNSELEAGNPATVQYETAVHSLQMLLEELETGLTDNAAEMEALSSK